MSRGHAGLERGDGDVRIAGRYRLLDRLSSGGMGTVYRAEDERGRLVAIKLIAADLEHGSGPFRFRREARLAASFDHPNIVRVRDHGRCHGPADESLFLAMDLIEGPTVAHLLSVSPRPPLGLFCALASQLLAALAYLHARDVLHRDIKPSNLLVARRADGSLALKLADFGVAADLKDDRLTQEGRAVGTPSYMSPEQARGQSVLGPPADLYAVGVLLFRIVSGRLPFSGTQGELFAAKLRDPPPRLAAPVGGDDSLYALVDELLQTEPERRPQVAAAVRARLEPHATTAWLDDESWYQALRIAGRDSAATTVLGSDSPSRTAQASLWGRAEERAVLHRVAREAERGEGRLVIVEGDIGMGKTALVDSVAIGLREEGRFSVVQARSLGQGLLRGLRGAIEKALGAVGEPRAALEGAVEGLFRRGGSVDRAEIDELVDFLRPQEAEISRSQEACFAVVARVLRRMASLQPVLLILDGLEAADRDGMAFLEHLLFELRLEPDPLFIVAAMRPRLRLEGDAPASSSLEASYRGMVTRLSLEPLSDEILRAALPSSLSAERRDQIVAEAGGNPWFSQMLAAVAEMPQPGEASRVEPSASHPLPPILRSTLQSLLEERLSSSRSAGPLREILVALAVLGGRAPAPLLVDLVEAESGRPPLELEVDVDRLVELQLLKEQDLDQVAFAQPPMRGVVIEGLAPRRLRRLHRRAADLLIAADPEREAGAIGDHLQAAGVSHQAVEWWLRAQRTSFHHGECRLAAQWGQKALSSLPAGEEADAASLLLGRTLREMLEYQAAVEVLEPIAAADSPDETRFRAAEILGEVLQEMGDDEAWGRCIAAIERDLPVAPSAARRAGLRASAFWANHRLEVARAEALASEALEEGATDPLDDRVAAQKRLFWALFYQVKLDRAEAVARALIAAGTAASRSDVVAEGYRFLGKIHQETSAFDASIEAFEEALLRQRRLGRQSRILNLYLDIMFVACAAERFETTQQYIDSLRRVRPETTFDFTGILVRLTELRCRALRDREDVSEALGELHAHVRETSWGFRHVVWGEWLWSLVREGRAAEIRDEIDAYLEAVTTLPPLVWIARQLGYLANDLGSDEPWRHEAALRALELSAVVYERLYDPERAGEMRRMAASGPRARD